MSLWGQSLSVIYLNANNCNEVLSLSCQSWEKPWRTAHQWVVGVSGGR